MAVPCSTAEELRQIRSPTSRVLDALDDHALTSIVAVAAELSVLQTLRILQDLKEKGLVEQFGEDCWGKRR